VLDSVLTPGSIPALNGCEDMARRANYGFEKRQKELKKQQKQTEKLEKKQQKKDEAAAAAAAGADVPAEDETDLADDE
jgi:hypothetical protein